MYLIPKPNNLTFIDGIFSIFPQTKLMFTSALTVDFETIADSINNDITNYVGHSLKTSRHSHIEPDGNIYFSFDASLKEEAYSLKIKPDYIEIKSSTESGFFYGAQTLIQLIKQYRRSLPCLKIDDNPRFKIRGYYYDMARGKVTKISTMKTLIDLCSHYKLNQLQLYIEHTFAFEGYSEMWSVTDPLTAEEIIELDAYAKKRHVELVPSLSTFGHLYEALKTDSFVHLCERDDLKDEPYSWIDRMNHHTLNTQLEESADFVKNMIDQFLPLFSSKYFNICADETFDLGTHRSKKFCEELGKGPLYVNFLNKIIKYVQSKEKTVMFWGDVILHYPELVSQLPKNVVCLNWDYNVEPNEENIKIIAESPIEQCLCPSVMSHNQLMNPHDRAFQNISKMADYADKYNAIGILNTDWGDFGHINLFGNLVPGLIYGAAFSWQCKFKENFEDINEALSVLHYNDTDGTLINLLTELADRHFCSFAPLVWWMEKNDLERIESITQGSSEVALASQEIESIRLNILDIRCHAPSKTWLDFDEFDLSCTGIDLFNRLYLHIAHKELASSISPLEAPTELAQRIECWFLNYKEIWLQRGKPSELYRLQDFFRKLCKYLRQK